MNPWSLTVRSVSKIGAWNQGKSRRWASSPVSSVPCMDSGADWRTVLFLAQSVFFPFYAAVRNRTEMKLCRDEGLLAAPQRALLRPERFLPFPPSLHFWAGVWLQEANQMEGLAAFTPRLRERLEGCRGDQSAKRHRTRVSPQSCSGSLQVSPACLIRRGRARKEFHMREKGGRSLEQLWQKLTQTPQLHVWYIRYSHHETRKYCCSHSRNLFATGNTQLVMSA